MKKIIDSLESAIANVHTAFPSVFTKQDVVSILESLHAEAEEEAAENVVAVNNSGLNENQIQELITTIQENVSRTMDRMDVADLADLSSAEFNINYGNTIELEQVDINVDNISEAINELIEERILGYFENLATEEEAETGTPYASEQ